jgi:Pyruvate/2-oxoacid:ferredoxin oxidoreductase delta subunit
MLGRKNNIDCPLCFKFLVGKFTNHTSGQMARWYWYCKHCKLSITKTIRKGDVK